MVGGGSTDKHNSKSDGVHWANFLIFSITCPIIFNEETYLSYNRYFCRRVKDFLQKKPKKLDFKEHHFPNAWCHTKFLKDPANEWHFEL